MYSVSFHGGETSGSVAKQPIRNNDARKEIKSYGEPPTDTVSFRSNRHYIEEDNGTSIIGSIAKLAVTAGVIIGGLGYAHKAGWVNKISNNKVKDIANKITEPCHNLCSKAKDKAINLYNKIANHFKK